MGEEEAAAAGMAMTEAVALVAVEGMAVSFLQVQNEQRSSPDQGLSIAFLGAPFNLVLLLLAAHGDTVLRTSPPSPAWKMIIPVPDPCSALKDDRWACSTPILQCWHVDWRDIGCF